MSIDNQPQIGGFPARTASSSVPSRPAVATLPPPDPRAAVSIRGLYKRFDRKIAVNGLSLDIPVGSFFGLVGPNGAGKTTTLNMVTGLLVPDAGTAMILGQDVWQDVNAAKREIGVMPQPDQIFDRLTGMQLLIYSGMLRGMKRDVAHSRAGDLLNAFDLVSAADTMVSDYSAGMTKKICLASAMIHSPRILVLDEPFESVDPVSSANLKDILAEYASTGGTVIISSHVMSLVENLQREDLDPVEEAAGIRELMTRCDLTQEQAARKLGKSRSALANSLRLLNLPETVLELLKSGFITIGHAKVVLGLPTPAQMIADNQLNVRQAEALCKKLAKPAKEPVAAPLPSALPVEVEESLKQALGSEVRVAYHDGKGKLTVHFYSDDQLKAFANLLGQYSVE